MNLANKRQKKYSWLTALIILSYFPMMAVAGERLHLRNQRYCEILIQKKRLDFAVYNTIGLNQCPESIWDKITIPEIKKQTASLWVHLNGPRYWTIDGMKNSKLVDPTIRTLGGLEMREAGILHLELFEFFKGVSPYHSKTVDRETTWIYLAGKPIYELIDHQGRVFVMQSYSVQKIPQTQASLAQLSTTLKLPMGWKFRSGTLKKDTLLKAINNKATVVQDEHLNTYQLATHDFLE